MQEPDTHKGDALVIPLSYVKLFRSLWEGRRILIAGTLICAFMAGVTSFFSAKTYESRATMVLFPTPFKLLKDEVNALLPKVLTVADYNILLKSDGVLRKVADKIKAKGTWPKNALENINDIDKLRRRMAIDIEVVKKTAMDVERSPVMVLRATAGKPEQAQELADTWAQVAEELATELNVKGKTGLQTFVEDRFKTAEKGLISVQGKIRDIEIEWNDDLEQARMKKKNDRLLSYEEKLIDLQLNIATTKAEITNLQATLANEPDKKILWKSPPMVAVFLEKQLAGDKKPDAAGTNETSGYKEEVINEVNVYLKQKVTLKESELKGMEEHAQKLQASMDSLAIELQALRAEVANRTFDRKQLDMQEVPLKRSYDLLASKVEQAKIADSEEANMPDIKIATGAVLPDKSLNSGRSTFILFGACAGFIVALFGLLLRSLLSGIV